MLEHMLDEKYIYHPASGSCWSISWCDRAIPLIRNCPRAFLLKCKFWVSWLCEQSYILYSCNKFIFKRWCDCSVLCKYYYTPTEISIFPFTNSLLLYFFSKEIKEAQLLLPKLVRWCRSIYRSNAHSGLYLLRLWWYKLNCWTKIALS